MPTYFKNTFWGSCSKVKILFETICTKTPPNLPNLPTTRSLDVRMMVGITVFICSLVRDRKKSVREFEFELYFNRYIKTFWPALTLSYFRPSHDWVWQGELRGGSQSQYTGGVGCMRGLRLLIYAMAIHPNRWVEVVDGRQVATLYFTSSWTSLTSI